ncbi:hypothetical protein SDC9_89610 [bioreactor metagenome]|uniref:Uncharacterized protein n=1 Tax=bioreactor metagenome TaxID=1076179 RepID=A0A644ZRD1_9ZZZZ
MVNIDYVFRYQKKLKNMIKIVGGSICEEVFESVVLGNGLCAFCPNYADECDCTVGSFYRKGSLLKFRTEW